MLSTSAAEGHIVGGGGSQHGTVVPMAAAAASTDFAAATPTNANDVGSLPDDDDNGSMVSRGVSNCWSDGVFESSGHSTPPGPAERAAATRRSTPPVATAISATAAAAVAAALGVPPMMLPSQGLMATPGVRITTGVGENRITDTRSGGVKLSGLQLSMSSSAGRTGSGVGSGAGQQRATATAEVRVGNGTHFPLKLSGGGSGGLLSLPMMPASLPPNGSWKHSTGGGGGKSNSDMRLLAPYVNGGEEKSFSPPPVAIPVSSAASFSVHLPKQGGQGNHMVFAGRPEMVLNGASFDDDEDEDDSDSKTTADQPVDTTCIGGGGHRRNTPSADMALSDLCVWIPGEGDDKETTDSEGSRSHDFSLDGSCCVGGFGRAKKEASTATAVALFSSAGVMATSHPVEAATLGKLAGKAGSEGVRGREVHYSLSGKGGSREQSLSNNSPDSDCLPASLDALHSVGGELPVKQGQKKKGASSRGGAGAGRRGEPVRKTPTSVWVGSEEGGDVDGSAALFKCVAFSP